MAEKLPKAMSQPKWAAPMLATLTYDFFSDPNWIFECKLDGMRCLLHKRGKDIAIYSRNKKIQNHSFPEIVKALQKISHDFILDSEIVTFDKKVTSFEKFQARMHVLDPSPKLIKEVPVYSYVFDILHLDGYNLCGLSLLQRKQILLQTFKFKDPLRHLEYKVEHGEKFLKQACKAGWEGLIAKLATGIYENKRSRNWLKFKCSKGQELIIAGYTQPQGSRSHFGALLLGYYEKNKLKYAGKVGTGFDQELLQLLFTKMSTLKRETSPFADYSLRSKNVVWLEPKLVAQIQFTEWTSDGHLRHPSFIGLRLDKKAKKVVRE